MFAKLLKYELRSNAVTYSVLSLCAVGVSLLGGFLLRRIFQAGDLDLTGSSYFSMMMLMLLVVFSLAAYAVAIYIMQLVRFYKHKFTDEGYLTFTLPVTVHQIFLSSALSMLIWVLVSGAVLALCLLVMYLIGTVGTDYGQYIQEFLSAEELYSDDYGYMSVLEIVSQAIATVSGVILPLTCLTVGASIARKHKILGAFGAYYVISMIVSFVEGLLLLSTSFSSMLYSEEAYMELTLENTLITMAINLTIAVAGYFLSTGLMKRRLNLS